MKQISNNKTVFLILIIGTVSFFSGCQSTAPSQEVHTGSGQESSHVEVREISEPASGTGIRNDISIGELDTLPEYLEYAALNNARLEALFYQWRAALERAPQAGALPDPKFTYGYFIREVETRVGPQDQRFGIGQTFPWFGKTGLRTSKATEAANAEYAMFQAEKLKVFNQVTQVFFEYYYLRQALDITQENIELLKSLERVAQVKVRGGSSVGGVIKAQVEIGKLEDRMRTLSELREPLVARLNAALNLPSSTQLPWPETMELEVTELDREQLLSRVTETSPELKALEHRLNAEEIGIRLAKKDFYPDVTLGMDYIATGDASNPNSAGSGKDPVIAMISINLPLWHGKYRAGLREAMNRREGALGNLQNRTNELQAQLKLALYHFEDSERKLRLYQETLMPLATQSLGVAQESYEAGKSDFLELIDAQRLALEFQLAYQRAFADRYQALSEIEMLMGERLFPSDL